MQVVLANQLNWVRYTVYLYKQDPKPKKTHIQSKLELRSHWKNTILQISWLSLINEVMEVLHYESNILHCP